jgi:methylenetetrahydrofolate reductase (NADPH)
MTQEVDIVAARDSSSEIPVILGSRQSALEQALRNTSYEVLPLRQAEESIVSAVPLTVPLSVTMTAGKGVQPTIELTERLAAHGYAVTPHLAARLFLDRVHLADTVDRLRGAGVSNAFVIAGDGADPHGPFTDALGLLEELQNTGHPFRRIGIGGYPEGHAHLDDELVDLALQRKSTHATHITTQMCFNPATMTAWARQVRSGGVCLPIRIGLPGAVTRQKLVRISAGLGLGPSSRFLRKQRSMFWRFFLPGGYQPDRLIQALAPRFGDPGHALTGFHLFTFNEVARTEAWRQAWLQRLAHEALDHRRSTPTG